MPDEPPRPGQLPKRQLAALRRYMADEVYPFNAVHRRALDRAGLSKGRLSSLDDLRRLRPVSIDEVGSGAGHLLEPAPDAIRSNASLTLRVRVSMASLLGRRETFDREELAPRFKPVMWTRDGRLRTGWSVRDLEKLGDLGRRLLERADVRASDRLLVAGLATDNVAFWQLSLGARAGGVSTLHLDDAERGILEDGSVTVVAGRHRVLGQMFDGGRPNEVRTVIVVGSPLTVDERAEISELSGATVVQAWAPKGVRTLWSEARGREGFITAADAEIVEIVDSDDRPVSAGADGEVVWTSLDWAGTVLLRLRTGVHAAQQPAPSGRGGFAITLRGPVPVVR